MRLVDCVHVAVRGPDHLLSTMQTPVPRDGGKKKKEKWQYHNKCKTFYCIKRVKRKRTGNQQKRLHKSFPTQVFLGYVCSLPFKQQLVKASATQTNRDFMRNTHTSIVSTPITGQTENILFGSLQQKRVLSISS